MTKRVAVILSGSGHQDGSEIHETTCALLALDKAGAEYVGFAPNIKQFKVANHLDGSTLNETRNCMTEAARIMRGNVKPLAEASVDDFDALILPGGFGAALNLCNYGNAGRSCEIDNNVADLILAFVKNHKPVGAICIAPVVVAKALEGSGLSATLTIGNDAGVASDIESFGAKHQSCAVDDAIVDSTNKIVTTPAYMLATRICQVEAGIGKLVAELLKLT